MNAAFRATIGVHASNSRRVGGQFQFLTMLLDALFAADMDREVLLFYFFDDEKLSQKYVKKGWQWIRLPRAQGSLLGPRAGPLALSWLQAAFHPLGLQVSSFRPGGAGARQEGRNRI